MDPLLNSVVSVKKPADTSVSVLNFTISRYQGQFDEAFEISPHFTNYMTIIPGIIILLMFYYEKEHVRNYLTSNFAKITNVLSLYKFNINEIFKGKKPKSTLVVDTG